MSGIRLDHVSKRYPNGVVAVDSIDLDVADGEFVVLVGPSGCGKTTLLRSVAGLEDITSGTLYIGGEDVTGRPPQRRDIAMVFQDYALYPHMSVRENLGYGLKLRGIPKADRDRRVSEVAHTLGLEELLARKPAKLSGGQRQRVAMGRAIIREPKAFLMDEPLSNLDAKLRVSMRAELSRLHERLGVTTLYVTHDQVEAMTLGQRVAVLRDGMLQQVDTPQRLFHKPKNLFVAAFIGSPSMNLVEAQLTGQSVRFAGFELPLPRRSVAADRTGKAIVGIRPSALEHGGGAERELPRIGVVPEVVEQLGDETHVIFTIEAPPVSADAVLAATEASDQSEGKLFAGDERATLTARVDGKRPVTVGDRLELAVDTGALHFFDPATGLALDAGTRTELVA